MLELCAIVGRMKREALISLLMIIWAHVASADAKTFVYCSEGSPSTFNPQLATDGTTHNASSRPIYNRLIEFKSGETTLIAGLAEDWVVEKGGLAYTFRLRKGVKFHTTSYFKPTRDFNADDVLFSFNRMRIDSHPFHNIGGRYEYFNSMSMQKVIRDIIKVNDYTVRFVLSQPEGPFLAELALDFGSILSAEYGEKMLKAKTPEKLDQFPIGTGPFIFESYERDKTIRYVAHPQFFRGRALLDQLVFRIVTNPTKRFEMLKSGECHFIAEPAPSDLAAMRRDPHILVMSQPGLNVAYISMNVEKKPFDQVLVRQAVHQALNRERYVAEIYGGNAQIAKNPIPPTLWSYNKSVKDYEYDPEKAKTLLKKAGYPDGFSTELWYMPVSRPYNPNGKRMGELMREDLAKIGIRVNLVTFDWPTYLAKSKTGEHMMGQFGWTGDIADPDNFLGVNLSCASVSGGTNRSRWCFAPFDELIQRARRGTDQDERARLYEEAQVIFKKEAPWVTLVHSVVFRAMRKNVIGYRVDPFGADYFHGVDLK